MTEQKPNDQFHASSFMQGHNAEYLEQMYARFANDPGAVDAAWADFFRQMGDDEISVKREAAEIDRPLPRRRGDEKSREDVESGVADVLDRALQLALLTLVLQHARGAVQRREDIEIAMEESMMEIVPRLEKRTPYVALASSIATLLGLLGTIMGLIQAFTAVANANPAEKADLLSASISVAMNTTAFGLMVAIPLLVIHAILTSKTGDIVDSLEMATVKALNVFSRRAKRASTEALASEPANDPAPESANDDLEDSDEAPAEA